MMNFNKKNILKYATAYDNQYKSTNEKVEKEIKCLLKKQRYLKKEEFVKIGEWKSKRPRKHYKSKENDDLTVKKITRCSFSTKDERTKIEALIGQQGGLKGVGYPVASTILHFAFPHKYPIMDFRIIRSLGLKQPSTYKFDFWKGYCKKIQAISKNIACL